jgi:hypothetical protein
MFEPTLIQGSDVKFVGGLFVSGCEVGVRVKPMT